MSTRQLVSSKSAPVKSPSFTPAHSTLLQRKCACGGTPGPTGECEACRQKRATGMLQRTADHSSSFIPNPSQVPSIVHEVLRSPGQPLDAATRAFMEPRFGHNFGQVRTHASGPAPAPARLAVGAPRDAFEREADAVANRIAEVPAPLTEGRFDFSSVRIHADALAAESARQIDAKAFTVGHDIVFDAGEYAPQTLSGQKLLAHELTHVVQQRGQGLSIQRKETEKTACAVHAYDNSNPKDTAVIPKSGGVGVTSVANLVSKVNAYVDDPTNSCSCVNRLEINGHGTDGYQSVGNGSSYVNDDKALVHDSKEEHLKQMASIKFCSTGLLILMGCHVGQGKGQVLLSRLSASLPGKLIGGAQHFTGGTGLGGKRVVGAGDLLNKDGTMDWDKADPFLTSPFVRWHITIAGKEYVINGTEATSSEGKAKLKAGEKIKVKTPEGEVKIK